MLQDMKLLTKYFNTINFYLLPTSLVSLIIGLLFVEGFMAVSNIALGAVGILVILDSILNNRISKSIPTSVLFCSIFSFLILFIGVNFSSKIGDGSINWVKRWAIFVYFGLIFYLLPKQNSKVYVIMLLSFIIPILCIDFYVLYKYYYLIIVNKGANLPSETWINFMDLMGIYIFPFRYTHHTLAFFNILALSMIWFISKYFNASFINKFITFFLILFIFFMVHFYSSRMAVFVLYLITLVCIFTEFKNFKYGKLFSFITFVILIFTLYFSINKIPTLKLKADKLITELDFYKVSSIQQIKNGPEYRLKSYFISLESLKNNFWYGIGLKNMGAPFEHNSSPYPLNNYLYLAVAIGFPFAFCIFILHFFPLFKINIFTDIGLVILTIYLSHFFYSLIDAAIILPVYVKFFAFWTVALIHIKYNLSSRN